MNQFKAVVLQKEGRFITILLADGSFRKIYYREPVEIGVEITVDPTKGLSLLSKLTPPRWKKMISIAAIFLLVFLGVTGWNLYEASIVKAMISIDAQSSIQLMINGQGKVLDVQTLNEEAVNLLGERPLTGLPWQEAVSNIMERSVDFEYLKEDDPLVLLGYFQMTAQNEQTNGITSEKLAQEVTDNIVKHGINAHVLAYDMTSDEQTKAAQEGLTLGEYALLNTANKAGIPVRSGEIKESAVRSEVFKEQAVQEQIKRDSGLGVVSTKVQISDRQNGEKSRTNTQSQNQGQGKGKTNNQFKAQEWGKNRKNNQAEDQERGRSKTNNRPKNQEQGKNKTDKQFNAQDGGKT